MSLCLVEARGQAAADAVRSAWDRGQAVAVVDPGLPAPEAARVLACLAPKDPVDESVAAVVATSGTTGLPRAAELTWAGMAAVAQTVNGALASTADDRWLCCLPLGHVGGLAVVARAWAGGLGLVATDRFDAAQVEAAIASGVTLVSLVPTMIRRLATWGIDPTLFRRILVGGAPMTGPLPANATATYGMTETWGGVIHGGWPLAGTEVSIVPGDPRLSPGWATAAGPRGESESAGVSGQILLRGPAVMRGYRQDPGATAVAIDPAGWLATGDLGAVGIDGRLTVTGRSKEVIITGGTNVSPLAVEAVLAAHPGIGEVCVVGVDDPEWGQRVVAFVVAASPGSVPVIEDLRAWTARFLPPAQLPRQVVVVDALPRTSTGKPQRHRLVAELEAGSYGKSPGVPKI
ncbi:MAG: class I adenylate-forming enzyme family protein [Acidimicrobiales bacterium]